MASRLLGRKDGATVVIHQTRSHGADLLFVRGAVDGVAVSAYLPVGPVIDAPLGQRRRVIAAMLATRLPAPDPLAGLVGREEGV